MMDRIPLRLETCEQRVVPREAGSKVWLRDRVHSFTDIARLIRIITSAMTEAGFSEDDVYWAHLGLKEALINANKHGHQGDWAKPIEIRYHVSAAGVVAEIEDQGPGFEPSQVPDPLSVENMDRSTGRGLLLMRSTLSGVCHNQQGNCVCLCIHHCEHGQGQEQPEGASGNSTGATPNLEGG
jgi:serine/threonine-protein kinase RsbW